MAMISYQAIVLGICNFVILIALILSMFVLKKSAAEGESRVKIVLKNVAALVMFLVIMVMQIYSLNCMVYGDCASWAWVLTAFAIFGTLTYIGFFAYLVFSARKVQTSLKDLMAPPTTQSV